jgi:two-component system chemotaxis sensor kinase CheA
MAGGEHIDPAMLDLFRAELDTHLPALGEGLLALEKESHQPKLLEAMMRAAHSIKGAARIVGVEPVVQVAHAMEDCFVAAQKGAVQLTADATDVLLRGFDFLTRLSQSKPGSETPDEKALKQLVADITAVRDGAAPAASGKSATPAATTATGARPEVEGKAERTETAVLHEFANESREHLGTVNDDLLHLEREGAEKTGGRIDRLFRAMHSVKGAAALVGCTQIAALAHEMETILGRLRQGQMELRSAVLDSMLAGVDLTQTLLDDVENSENVNIEPTLERLRNLLAEPRQPNQPEPRPPDTATVRAPSAEGPSTVRINVQILDRLMTLAGELVLVRNQALRAADMADLDPMRQVIQRLSAITTDMQQAVLLTRMQPVSNLFGKFPRMVRDLAKQLGKRIELALLGTEVELDKTILESLSDPLTHLIRNCCDHGIELPAERTAAGKSTE